MFLVSMACLCIDHIWQFAGCDSTKGATPNTMNGKSH